ncbi:PHP domain-containing protein [Yimella sp. cx-51]|uniref:PHP domain-containing protein n=1 Tax=Yimella sp. cx-51 TaxID=2770551 RepID=UPI00165D585D|nr:PHP domain-containing protein [Yimella sp. cx-51]MBC9956058.1 PHP domain-containing protein [Yimella sp. cx-51]QTH37408.1 PHP domain-containing protein [Yimella sp. cx-51]
MRIDLHTHSTESDGTESPAQVMESARAAGLDVVALTDHDRVAGWAPARARATEFGLGFLPGIEISCAINHASLHLLAYLIDPLHEELTAELDKARTSRETRAEAMVERLRADTGLTWPDVQAHFSAGTTIGRPHIADALVSIGVVRDRGEAFDRFLYSGSKYHASHYAIDPVRAVELVRAAGGVPVLAHPFAHVTGRVVADRTVESMVDAGLAGIEVDHRDQDETARAHARSYADRFGLIRTGSSDYHGAGKPNQLGENVTDAKEFERILEEAADSSSAYLP